MSGCALGQQQFLVLAVALFILLSAPLTLANTALDANWTPLAYGSCTKAPPQDQLSQVPPYSGSQLDPLIAEGVGSGSVGRTCNFNPSDIPRAQMPQLYKDGYLLAASTDLYNGRHLDQTNWATECNVNLLTADKAKDGAMCGSMCGVCMLINGPRGSGIFIVNEIADYGAVGQNGIGLNLHIDGRFDQLIRANGGVRKDIQFKRVPCPVSGPVYITVLANYYAPSPISINFVIYNYRIGIKAIDIRGGPNGGNQTWIPLGRSWTNKWHYESYDSCTGTSCPPWQKGLGPIYRSATDKKFEMRIISQLGNEIICTDLDGSVLANDTLFACRSAAGADLQFPDDSSMIQTSCNTSSVPANNNYYSMSSSASTVLLVATSPSALLLLGLLLSFD